MPIYPTCNYTHAVDMYKRAQQERNFALMDSKTQPQMLDNLFYFFRFDHH